MTSRAAGGLAAWAVIAATAAGAQPAQPPRLPQAPQPQQRVPSLVGQGTASISGRVTDERGKPVAGADITLMLVRGISAAAQTDSDGVYRFERLPDGQYTIQARRAGHVHVMLADDSGSPPPFWATTALVPDQHRDNVNLVLPREGRIRGRVVDAQGQPVAGVGVNVGRINRGRFERQGLTIVVVPNGTRATQGGRTGPDGTYELDGLPAGEVFVQADPGMRIARPGASVEYENTFHPDAPSADLAAAVPVEAGAVTNGVDIVMIGHALATMRLRLTPDPATLTDLQCNVVAFPGRQIRTVKIEAEGLATVQGLKEGRYTVWARARLRGDAMAAFMMVDFFRDTPDLSLPLQIAGRITGRVVAARGGLPPLEGLRVESALVSEGELVDFLGVDAADVSADGRFTLAGQFGTRRLSVTGLSPGWQIREILLGRQDVSRSAVEVPPATTLDLVVVVEQGFGVRP